MKYYELSGILFWSNYNHFLLHHHRIWMATTVDDTRILGHGPPVLKMCGIKTWILWTRVSYPGIAVSSTGVANLIRCDGGSKKVYNWIRINNYLYEWRTPEYSGVDLTSRSQDVWNNDEIHRTRGLYPRILMLSPCMVNRSFVYQISMQKQSQKSLISTLSPLSIHYFFNTGA